MLKALIVKGTKAELIWGHCEHLPHCVRHTSLFVIRKFDYIGSKLLT